MRMRVSSANSLRRAATLSPKQSASTMIGRIRSPGLRAFISAGSRMGPSWPSIHDNRRLFSTMNEISTESGTNSLNGAQEVSAESARPIILDEDLDQVFEKRKDEEICNKFYKIGPLIEDFEVATQFTKSEWNVKMVRKAPASHDELKKLRDAFPKYGGRLEPQVMIPEDERYVMLRDPAIKLIREMQTLNEGGVGKSFARLITGKRGTGKSATLMTAVAYARSAGWLTLYFPRGTDLVTAAGAYLSGTGGPVSVIPESNVGRGLFQQPGAGEEILQMFDYHHGEALAMLPQRRKYDHDLYKPVTGAEPNLSHIVMRGLAQAHRAADALYDLRMELNLVTEVPVLIAVDELNALYWPTALYFQSRTVKAHELVMAKAFRFVKHVPGDIEDDNNRKSIRNPRLDEAHLPKRGVVLGAETMSLSPPPHPAQLPPARFEQFETADAPKLETQRYSNLELQTMLNWYQMRNMCRPQSQADVSMCRTFTAGVGEKVARYAKGYLTTGL